MTKCSELSRRDFLRTTLGVGAALGAATFSGRAAGAQAKTFKIGLIGCGGRGRGAVIPPLWGRAAVLRESP